jgi:hypothetical protein
MSMTPGDDRQVSLSDGITAAESEFDDLDTGADESAELLPAETPWEAPSWAAHWKHEARDALGRFASHPELKTQYTPIQKQIEEIYADKTRREQEAAEYRKRTDPLWNVVQPFEQRYALQGIPVHQGVQQLFQAAELLNTNPDQAFPWLAGSYRPQNPQEALMRLAQSWGVDLNAAMQEQPYIDPTVTALLNPLQQQVQQLQQAIGQQQAAQQHQQHNALVSEISDFEAAKDENGKPLHPHFATVFDDMVALVKMGRATDLDTAYRMAVQFSPQLQTQSQGEAAEAARKKALQQAAARTAAAEKSEVASRTVAGKSQNRNQQMHLSIKDGIAKAAAELGD